MTSAKPIEISFANFQSRWRAPRNATIAIPSCVLTAAVAELPADKFTPKVRKNARVDETDNNAAVTASDEHFQPAIAQNTADETLLDSDLSNETPPHNSPIVHPDEHIAPMPAATVATSKPSLGLLAGGLGLVAAGGGGGGGQAIKVLTSAPVLKIVSFQVAENTTDVAHLAASDARVIQYSLAGTSGDDSSLFLLTREGVLTLKTGANFEAIGNASTDHSYKLGVNMTDLAGNVSHQTLTVYITDVNEAPVITSPAEVRFAEQSTGIAYQATAKDEDAGTVLHYSLSGTDAALFNVDTTTGAVTFKLTPNFQMPDDAGADNTYNFTLNVSDGALTTAQEVAIKVTPVVGTHFNLNFPSTISAQAQKGFQQAVSFWSSVLGDDVTINLDLDYASAGFDKNTIGVTFTNRVIKTYAEFRQALSADAVSDADKQAVASLSQSDTFGMLLNHTLENPFATPVLDDNKNNNNTSVYITRANAKALGLLSAHDLASTDAKITFNSAFNFDFDRSDGIAAGSIDFVGVAIHEIGHALGFGSGVDILDQAPGFPDADYTYVTPLDFFRYSTASSQSGVIDWTASTNDKYFSLDKGYTKIASFSTGVQFGDGNQNSHWKDGQGLGGLDPTLAKGELFKYTSLDQQAFDVIGWNLSASTDNFATPIITSRTNVDYFSKDTSAAYTVVGTDADAWNKLRFSIAGGDDASQFSIDPFTGVVKFKSTPDMANPTDSDANNIYKINVTASDGLHTSSALAVSIHVIPFTPGFLETLADTRNLPLHL